MITLIINGVEYNLVEINFPTFAMYQKEPYAEIAHRKQESYTMDSPELTYNLYHYQSIRINGKLYGAVKKNEDINNRLT